MFRKSSRAPESILRITAAHCCKPAWLSTIHSPPSTFSHERPQNVIAKQMVEEVATRIVERRAPDLPEGTVKAPRHTD
jgi:hypothetical protein